MAVLTNEKKERILAAAARLFRDKGYSATSMRDLAKAVDLKASSLYNHISSKEEILQDICLTNARHFQRGMQEVLQMNVPVSVKVEELLRLHIRIATRDVTSVISFNDEWRHLSEPFLSEFLEMRRNYERSFRQLIEQGQHEGVFKNIDTNVLLYTLFSSVRWLYDWYEEGKRLSAKDLENQIIPLLMDGVRK